MYTQQQHIHVKKKKKKSISNSRGNFTAYFMLCYAGA